MINILEMGGRHIEIVYSVAEGQIFLLDGEHFELQIDKIGGLSGMKDCIFVVRYKDGIEIERLNFFALEGVRWEATFDKNNWEED